MRFHVLLLSLVPFLISCSGAFVQYEPRPLGSNGIQQPPTNPPPSQTPPPLNSKNIMPVTVGNCGPNTYFNEICVTVRVCTPGTTNCVEIPNILVDTGSYGLRVFGSLIPQSVPLQDVQDGSGRFLATCARFIIGADWGPVKIAGVGLGGEDPVNVPIQVIDANFPGLPTDCQNPDVGPAQAGFNGILGVGLFTEDCGPGCASIANNRVYFLCGNGTCTSTAVPINQQVSNPISYLPVNNNGVIIQLPDLPNGEVASVTGTMILGIGTQANNMPASPQVFTADGNGYFRANINGVAYEQAFIDSGTNTNAFTYPLTPCPNNSIGVGFYCPATPTTVAAQVSGLNNVSTTFMMKVANANSILMAGLKVSDRLASSFQNAADFGLPFFFGRTVYVAIENRQTSLGPGPYWAF